MIEPTRAAVRPRVVSPETGDAVLLEDEVGAWLNGTAKTLRIVGGPGSGKTTAMRHIAAVFGPLRDVLLADGTADAAADPDSAFDRTIYSASIERLGGGEPCLKLASWDEDDLLEYCLARHRSCCSSIIGRIRSMPEAECLEGVPELWASVLDTFAADEAASDWRPVLQDYLAKRLPAPLYAQARIYCLGRALGSEAWSAWAALTGESCSLDDLMWLRRRVVQTLLAAQQVVCAIEDGKTPFPLITTWPRELVEETARCVAGSPAAWTELVDVVQHRPEYIHPSAATLLHAVGRGWIPPRRRRAFFDGAVFKGAVWPGIDLRSARLRKVDLTSADLTAAQLDDIAGERMILRRALLAKANLRRAEMYEVQAQEAILSEIDASRSDWQRADLRGANLHGANLRDAKLVRADLTRADLTCCDLRRARLNGARLEEANCAGAHFEKAELRKACLSNADLSSARFDRANLSRADLEGLRWPAAALTKANLAGADLTGAFMPQAMLRGAILRQAGLADVNFEEADLRNVDFSNCAFHLGSSRSGLVGSPLACEGSRTGFYTDELLEQGFKSPEEIRKANLRGADLRGARVDRADFYLVDLRDARYTRDQADHFRHCGAILVDRVERA
ncbi:MAG TPA: pentapeptide repeat-containing protein [Pirellulales bacterium]|nr:pentapeptide repeat-containing protein [Pirellulales bacterium]